MCRYAPCRRQVYLYTTSCQWAPPLILNNPRPISVSKPQLQYYNISITSPATRTYSNHTHLYHDTRNLPKPALQLQTRKMSSTSTPLTTPPTPQPDPRYAQLFHDLSTRFAQTSLPPEKWYILAISTIVASPDPERCDQLYLHLINQAPYSTPSARQELIRRLREALFKSIIIVGVCKPIEAILAISKYEREEDKDYTFTRENWQCDQANHDRGVAWLEKLYARNTTGTLDLFRAHQDFGWLSKEITYGLFLSDRGVLDDLDTQMVVLPAIMSQNLKNETHWHIRGTRRLGVCMEDVKVVWECIQRVAGFYGTVLDKVPTVEEVESDV
ncbi:hypothetical protein F9C07_2285408 [Aspergillus flavus]|uniref:Carboxymuconolactone decarboxylase-like domain-containing protein n=6 Tax=Aspergillus subgen. Circumdati TaxID=2720871 RepID=A0A7U2QVY6_ASPFN|nr:hypothetical protein Ao3042_04123 [Aspergillus oryzae 3.042]KDE75467.1 hypothetical protein AO1008_11804 [Aspergillus oryzae 100-8]QRD84850.1 hypothetical protein F9C07_2285408 [Aspergillus flavus]|eukprot:EIT79492.1 hypothetical protein Ao3042_04123 [Aspergillus oryzae 3.042]